MRQSREELADELRRRIREGRYAAGARMPSHRELQRELGASSVTLQRAFDRLVEQGYVEPRGVQGTFVAALLPHDSLVAIVFPDEPGRGGWNRYWTTAKRVAEEWRDGSARFRIYCITGQRPDAAAHRRLCEDAERGVIAGMLFVHPPFFLAGSPVFSSRLPRVCIAGSESDMSAYACSLVSMVDGDVPERIVAKFKDSGRRRLAVLCGFGAVEALRRRWLPLLRQAGIETRDDWWLPLPVDPSGAVCARGVARLLCSGGDRQRPDCMLIADDNLVPHATAGIRDAELGDPGAIAIAAHANYPGPTISVLPCLRYGPDMTAQLRTAVNELGALAAGGSPRNIKVSYELRDV
ncbi:MAG: winged helix-turn-helix transcriptional regulator [Planctomycetes bacterium]|nr:winged helix-turn-helix transcriptional regulator [Planctomycetota bacterium]